MTHRTLAEHFAAVLSLARPLPAVTVQVSAIAATHLGRVLAADAAARLPIPPFSNSAMDGFLVHAADLSRPGGLPVTLPVAGDVPAGSAPRDVPAGHAVRIMTGAPVPEDHAGLMVVPVELTDAPGGPHSLPDSVTIHQAPGATHIRVRGDNTGPGDVLAPAGTELDAGTLAGLISAGVPEVSIHRAPKILIVASGDELTHKQPVSPNTLAPGQIPDSNGPMLEALAAAARPEMLTVTHAGDSPAALRDLLDDLAGYHDVIITTGGVSVGAFDVVHAAVGARCPDAWFGHVAHKPGAPQGLATWAGTPVLCLPGNPVAAFVSYHLYVAPFLRVLAGAPAPADPWARPHVAAAAAADFPAPRAGRVSLIPTRVDFGSGAPRATPYGAQTLGSHMVASLAGTNAFAALVEPVRASESLPVYFY